jgi:hypothetical protein
MERRLKAQHHADSACADLATNVEPLLLGLFSVIENPLPLLGAVIALHRRNAHWTATGRTEHLFQDSPFGLEVIVPVQDVEVAHRLKHPVIQAHERLGDPRELLAGCFGGRGPIAHRAPVVVASPGAESDRARFESGA